MPFSPRTQAIFKLEAKQRTINIVAQEQAKQFVATPKNQNFQGHLKTTFERGFVKLD